VDRAAPEIGTVRSLIQTSAEALRFPAGRPTFPKRDPSPLRRPVAVTRRSAASFSDPRPLALPGTESRRAGMVLVSDRREPQPHSGWPTVPPGPQ
jgi:hypothetical protein